MRFVGYRYNLRLRSHGSYILVGIWCLVAVVLANAYAGTLFSFLSVTKLEPIVNSLDELAHSPNLKLIVQFQTDVANRFLVHIVMCNLVRVFTHYSLCLVIVCKGNYYVKGGCIVVE